MVEPPTHGPDANDAAAVVEEALRRWAAGEPLTGFAAEDYVAHGQPLPLHTVSSADPEARRRAILEAADFRLRTVQAGAGDRVLAEAFWALGGEGRGSAGLVWAVFGVRDGLIRSVTYFHDEHEARRAAGL